MEKVRFIQMLPNDALQLKDKVQITTNAFCDIEVKYDEDGHILIHIAGFPKVKRVIYG